MWNIVWLMKWSLLKILSNAKTNKARAFIPRVCKSEKVGSCTFSHSQLLSLCFSICHRFLSLSRSHSHSHPCSTFSSKMDLNSNLTPPLVIFSSTIDFDSNLTLPPLRQQELQNLRPGAWDPRESWARCRGQRNHSCQVIIMSLSLTDTRLLSSNSYVNYIDLQNGKRNH